MPENMSPEFFFRTYGSGKPLVILHGLLGQSDNWNTLGKKWSEKFRVIIPDARNHGLSFHHTRFDIPAMRNDLEVLLDQLNIHEPVFLLGHSMGGKVAMDFCLNFSARVEKLVVADMGIRAYNPAHDLIFEALSEVDFSKVESRSDVEDILKQKITDQGVIQFLMKSVYREGDRLAGWRFNLKSIKNSYSEILKPVSGEKPFNKPALFISGGKSSYIKKEDEAGIKSLFPGAEFNSIHNAGHWLHAEAPDLFFRIVTEFLERPLDKVS
jgi:esterase